jgi:uncharacterized membrane protein
MIRLTYNAVSEYERAATLCRRHTLTLVASMFGILLAALAAFGFIAAVMVSLVALHALPRLLLQTGCAVAFLVAIAGFFFAIRALIAIECRASHDAALARERYERIARSVGNY